MHWLTTDYWGGFTMGVVGNLVASALLVIPAMVRSTRILKAHSTRLHHETRQHWDDRG